MFKYLKIQCWMFIAIFTLLFDGKAIFYGALDWGLGHATRSVPIIRDLLKNNSVILGVTPLTRLIFDEEFPDLKKIELPPYNVKYSKTLPLWLKLALSFPRVSRIIAKEKKLLNKIITENNIDVIISDSRFGLYSEKAHSVFITHQLFLKAPVFKDWSSSVNQKYISKFNEVWVPDFENEKESLSGELSHGNNVHKHVKYIRPQSRLSDVTANAAKEKYHLLILLSGPEPTRSELEKTLLEKFKNSGKKTALVRGSMVPDLMIQGIDIFDLPSKEELKQLILSSEKIICRSGYSTLMDMHALGKKDLILVPTPGQTEQEYLAEYWKQKFNSEYLPQNKIVNFIL